MYFLFFAHQTPVARQCLRPGFRGRQNAAAAAAGFDFPRILRIHRVYTMMASDFTRHGGRWSNSFARTQFGGAHCPHKNQNYFIQQLGARNTYLAAAHLVSSRARETTAVVRHVNYRELLAYNSNARSRRVGLRLLWMRVLT